jgi:hypothetical protein
MKFINNNSVLNLLIYYVFVVIWWALLFAFNIQGQKINYFYQFAFGLIPLIGGIAGLTKAKKWGFLKSKVGSALFFISFGLITWGVGQMLWSIYYNLILEIEVPYPSLADVGYILSWPLWAIGMIKLSNATGAKFSVAKLKGKIFLLIIPLLLVALSYYLLVIIARGGVLSDFAGGYYKIFFDLAYPIGDVVILSFATLIFGLSFRYLGGKYKLPIIVLLLGFVVNYIVDFSFSYVTSNQTYYNGHWVDLLFPTAMMLIAVGVNSFDTDIASE